VIFSPLNRPRVSAGFALDFLPSEMSASDEAQRSGRPTLGPVPAGDHDPGPPTAANYIVFVEGSESSLRVANFTATPLLPLFPPHLLSHPSPFASIPLDSGSTDFVQSGSPDPVDGCTVMIHRIPPTRTEPNRPGGATASGPRAGGGWARPGCCGPGTPPHSCPSTAPPASAPPSSPTSASASPPTPQAFTIATRTSEPV